MNLTGHTKDQVRDSRWISANPPSLEKQLDIYVLLAMGSGFLFEYQGQGMYFAQEPGSGPGVTESVG